MKVIGEGVPLLMQAASGEGKMVHNEVITSVLLDSGWHPIIPGSFQMFKTPDRQVPFIQFKMDMYGMGIHVVQIFPNALYGLAYPNVVTEDSTDE